MPKFTSLALGSAAALLLAPTATEATPVQLVCGNAQPVNKVYGDPELDGAPQYMRRSMAWALPAAPTSSP